jgi:hypothetical protein
MWVSLLISLILVNPSISVFGLVGDIGSSLSEVLHDTIAKAIAKKANRILNENFIVFYFKC